MTENGLTHLDAAGQARMVDVSGKEVTARIGDRDRHGAAVGSGRRGAAGRERAERRRARCREDRRHPGRQADAGPDPAVPPDRTALGLGRSGRSPITAC